MAYAAVASLSQTIDLVLNYYQQSVSPQFKDQITSIQRQLNFLQSFIEASSNRVNNWEETIREVTDRAEQIIELLLSDSLLESTVGSSRSSEVEKGKYEVRYSSDELERVTEEIESIVSRVMGRRRTGAVDCYGVELIERISRLCIGSFAPTLETISIVGIGGMGKSDLAINVFNNPLVVKHFDHRHRLTSSVSDERRKAYVKRLKRKIEKSKGQRFLIALHDVRNLDDLQEFKSIFANFNANGSRIIFTTRSFELAMAADYIHEMGFLDDDITWDLLREKIFKGDPCPHQLEDMGKMIARRCRGFKLFVEVVSVILGDDQTEAAWADISENIEMLASEDNEENEFLLMLRLVYMYLPHHLRPCFLYLGCFLEDHEISVSKLIKLWVAEGFLDGSERKSFEETAEEYVEDLVRRSLVSVSKRKSDGRIKRITVHNLMRYLCLKHARLDHFVLRISRFCSFDRRAVSMGLQSCRRVSSSIYVHDFLRGVCDSTIRTMMLYLHSSGLGVRWSIGNVRLLRILDLSNAYGYELPEEVFQLFHLRYLAFYCGFSISEAISNLENLQTLIICPRADNLAVEIFPEGLWRMQQLRHLFMHGFKLPSQNIATSSGLENLQTLRGVKDFSCSRNNLKLIPNLKKLAIFFTRTSKGVFEYYELHNLVFLQNLESLKINMSRCYGEHYVTSCAFPPTLKKLSLIGTRLPWRSMEMVASLPNLKVLKLKNRACVGDTWETSEGGFSRLTFLQIQISEMKNWITKSSHFPKLKSLVLCHCLDLLKVPKDIGEVPTLRYISLDDQNQSLLDSAKQIKAQRELSGYHSLRIRIV